MTGAFDRRDLIGYATVGALAVIPSLSLAAIGIPLISRSSPFVQFSLIALVLIALLRPLQLVVTRHEAPTRQLVRDVKTNWSWVAIALFLAVTLPQTLVAATAIKKNIPELNPYYLDPALTRLDAVFGVDPWRVTHWVFGPLATRAIDLLYVSWHFAQIALACWIVLARNRAFQLRAALCYQIAWLVMGGILAAALASVGPCFVDDFFGDPHFAELMARLPPDLYAVRAMDYLLETHGQDALGGGISAMPSLHVAIAVLLALCVRDRLPRWQGLGWAYAAIIFLGSVHLGWHYVSDGLVAAGGMVAIWLGVGWYLDRIRTIGRPDPVATAR
jgi:hypothetical protein